MEPAGLIAREFQEDFFHALFDDDASILFAEIKNSENLAGAQGHRLALPEENQLLAFYLKDVRIAGKLGVYRSAGEAVISRIESDEGLANRLNGPLLSYQETGKFRCPVYVGITFFRIMVLEGLHQRLADHLWLHYFPHFAMRLVARARPLAVDDENYEFPTQLSYLLYELVDGVSAWIEDAARLTQRDDVVSAEDVEGRHVYISFEAAEALGRVLEPILRSDHVASGLKKELLSVVLGLLRRIKQHQQLSALFSAVIKSVIYPHDYKATRDYVRVLRDCYDAQDHVLRAQNPDFGQALERAIRELR